MKRALLQTENRVLRTYRGGKQLDLFLGKTDPCDSFFPEDWISSFVEAKNKEYRKGEGISKVLLNGREVCITEVVSVCDFGKDRCQSGVLIKLLDSAERLGMQVHPTPEFSRKYFGSEYGKTECWHILKADKDVGACVYIGFKEGISKEKWRSLFENQDIEAMLSCLHRFEVNEGDTILVPAGTPHAIGAGCFLLEIQEPSDYTMRVEKETLSGEKLTPFQIHYGVGEDAMLDCFIYEGLSHDGARAKYFIKPKANKDFQNLHTLVSYDDTPCFALEKVLGGCVTIYPESFLTILVLSDGKATVGGEELFLKRSEKYFIPYGCGEITIEGAEVIICYPPEI